VNRNIEMGALNPDRAGLLAAHARLSTHPSWKLPSVVRALSPAPALKNGPKTPNEPPPPVLPQERSEGSVLRAPETADHGYSAFKPNAIPEAAADGRRSNLYKHFAQEHVLQPSGPSRAYQDKLTGFTQGKTAAATAAATAAGAAAAAGSVGAGISEILREISGEHARASSAEKAASSASASVSVEAGAGSGDAPDSGSGDEDSIHEHDHDGIFRDVHDHDGIFRDVHDHDGIFRDVHDHDEIFSDVHSEHSDQ
jgi:hypothetical protein